MFAFSRLAVFVLLTPVFASGALAFTTERITPLPKDLVFEVARGALLAKGWPIGLQDGTAGILKFTFREGKFEDPGAVIEIVEQESDDLKVRLAVPADFLGRGKVFLEQFLQDASGIEDGRLGRKLDRKPDWVYRTALRYVLKEFVTSPRTKEEVVKLADKDAFFIRFVFRDGRFEEPAATVQVIPRGERLCRLVVKVPSDSARRILLENRLMEAIRIDSGDEKENLN